MSALDNAHKQAAFTSAFMCGVVHVGFVSMHPGVVVPEYLKTPKGCILNFNHAKGKGDCYVDAVSIRETLSFKGIWQQVVVPWDAVAFVDQVVSDTETKRLFPIESDQVEETRKKIKAAVTAKIAGPIGIGFNPFDPLVVVPSGFRERAERHQSTQAKLIFNGGFGDLHINAEGIQETIKFLGEGQGPDAMIHCFVPWSAVSVVAEERSAAIRFDCPAPRWDDVRRTVVDPKARFELVNTEVVEYTPTPPRTGHLKLLKGGKS